MNLHKVITSKKVIVEAFSLLGAIIGMFWIGYTILQFASTLTPMK